MAYTDDWENLMNGVFGAGGKPRFGGTAQPENKTPKAKAPAMPDLNAALLENQKQLDALLKNQNAQLKTQDTAVQSALEDSRQMLRDMEADGLLAKGTADVTAEHLGSFEGLAAGPAVVKRYGVERASDMADDEGFLELEGTYIAQGILNYLYVASPQRIILGGGVPDHAPKLMDRVRAKVLQLNNGYISTPELDDIDSYIVPPACDGNQGVLGAIALGAQALQRA